LRDSFTINIDLVSDVNLERGRAENKGLEINNKVRFREISLGNKQ